MNDHDTSKYERFSNFCSLLETLQKKTGRATKIFQKDIIQRYFNKWRLYGGSLFPVIRLLLPHIDKKRLNYRIKEKTLSKIYVNVLCLPPESPDGRTLINWRIPGKAKMKTVGDFASVLYGVLLKRSTFTGKSVLTISDINEKLDQLNQAESFDQQKDCMRSFYTSLTPLEQKWIVRIILKDLKIGLTENSILNIYHPDALNMFNVCSDLYEVVESLNDSSKRIEINGLSVFHPFQPMLCERIPINNCLKVLNTNTFYIENKLDGERIQLHMKNGEFQYWSRKATQYTKAYGSNKNNGTLTPFIYDVFNPSIYECILDGEMLVYDPNIDDFLPFGSLKTAILDQSDEKMKKRPCFVIFDVLYVNGKCLTNQPMINRIKLLPEIMKEKYGYVMFHKREEAKTTNDIIKALEKIIELHGEGLVIKDPNSTYELGTRSKRWIKIKPEYINSLCDELDVLIVGGYYGNGYRRGKISHFLCAVLKDKEDIEGENNNDNNNNKDTKDMPHFVSFCKFGTGYSLNELEGLSKEKNGNWKPLDPNNIPSWLSLEKKDMPDVYIRPDHSQIVQLKATEIVPSVAYSAGVTLRFPRFEKIREDKTYENCLTLKELIQLRNLSSGRLQTKTLNPTNTEPISLEGMTSKKKRRITAKSEISIMHSFVGADTSNIDKMDSLFEDIEFCVMPGINNEKQPNLTKQKLEILIVEHGGKIIQNPHSTSTKYVIADKITLKVKNIINTKMHDIIKSQWVIDCIEKKKLLELSSRYTVFLSEKTIINLKKNMDLYGDIYTEEYSLENFKDFLQEMDKNESFKKVLNKYTPGNKSSDNKETENKELLRIISSIEERYIYTIYGLFRNIVGYFPFKEYNTDKKKIKYGLLSRLHYAEYSFMFYGGNSKKTITSECSHIFIDPEFNNYTQEIQKITNLYEKKPRFVNIQWIFDSIKQCFLVSESDYLPAHSISANPKINFLD
ncbi:ATP-dependent DNA ligase [Piromyces finnis]|uniref:DNA ligase n=1 Tax=Piromyces finnis TaxID=1754191 RepID=A0A1Y1VE98_9FUNG|nr:ATP-dependent DNA ligase [Piromyces finnis]|eukprot:ORX53424.1 ATP-dependent DNA ligase [Piromyces finnis]